MSRKGRGGRRSSPTPNPSPFSRMERGTPEESPLSLAQQGYARPLDVAAREAVLRSPGMPVGSAMSQFGDNATPVSAYVAPGQANPMFLPGDPLRPLLS